MTLTIEALRGVWRAQVDSRTEFAETLEELLLKIAPDAPEEYVWHAAEVLGGVLGAEVVELSEIPDKSIDELFDALMGIGDIQGDPTIPFEDEPWQPTEAQKAYFEAMEDDGA